MKSEEMSLAAGDEPGCTILPTTLFMLLRKFSLAS